MNSPAGLAFTPHVLQIGVGEVKKENANFSLPDVPPGFPPQPPKTSTSAAVDSSRNQSPTCKENGSVGMHVQSQSQSPGVSLEQLLRRTLRKRFRPQFYGSPAVRRPAASPRRRGRPPKARFMSQLSFQDAETIISNQLVSSTTLSRPQEQMPCLITSLQMTKEQSSSQAHDQVGEQDSQINIAPSPNHPLGQQTNMKEKEKEKAHNISVDKNQRTIVRSTFHAQDIEETLIDISLTEVPTPDSGCETVGNHGHNNQISEGIDPKILQRVANVLQDMAGSQTALGNTKVNSRSSNIEKNLVIRLRPFTKSTGILLGIVH